MNKGWMTVEISNEDTLELIRLVYEMRATQQLYFNLRHPVLLGLAKEYERNVDAMLQKVITGPTTEPTLDL